MSEFNKKRRAEAKMAQLEREKEAVAFTAISIISIIFFVCVWWCL